MVSDRCHLRNAIDVWKAWHKQWEKKTGATRALITRRVKASALYHWRAQAMTKTRSIAERSRRQEEALERLLRAILLRKCLVALRSHVFKTSTLRKLFELFRTRVLLDGMDTWRRRPPHYNHEHKQQASSIPFDVVKSPTFKRFHHPGKPRKTHCRCVYAVSRGQRCTCEPDTHLLRRVEELHMLAAHGLGERQGVCQSRNSHGFVRRSSGRSSIESPPALGLEVNRVEAVASEGRVKVKRNTKGYNCVRPSSDVISAKSHAGAPKAIDRGQCRARVGENTVAPCGQMNGGQRDDVGHLAGSASRLRCANPPIYYSTKLARVSFAYDPKIMVKHNEAKA